MAIELFQVIYPDQKPTGHSKHIYETDESAAKIQGLIPSLNALWTVTLRIEFDDIFDPCPQIYLFDHIKYESKLLRTSIRSDKSNKQRLFVSIPRNCPGVTGGAPGIYPIQRIVTGCVMDSIKVFQADSNKTLALHFDGDSTNNSLSNLRWGNSAENTKDLQENRNMKAVYEAAKFSWIDNLLITGDTKPLHEFFLDLHNMGCELNHNYSIDVATYIHENMNQNASF